MLENRLYFCYYVNGERLAGDMSLYGNRHVQDLAKANQYDSGRVPCRDGKKRLQRTSACLDTYIRL